MSHVAMLSSRNQRILCNLISSNEYRYHSRVCHREPHKWFHSFACTFSQGKQQYTNTHAEYVGKGNQGRVASRSKDYFHPTKTTSFKKTRSQNFAPPLVESKNYVNKSRENLRVSIIPPQRTTLSDETETDPSITVQPSSERKGDPMYQPVVGDYDELLGYVLDNTKDGRRHLLKDKSADVHECMRSFFLRRDTVVDCRKNLITFQQMMHDSSNLSTTASTATSAADLETREAKDKLSSSNIDATSLQQRFEYELSTQRMQISQALSTDQLIFNDALAVIILNRAVSVCAKFGLRKALRSLWEKTKELSCTDQKLLQSLLYVAATYGPSACDIESVVAKRKRQICCQNSGNMSFFTDIINVDDNSVNVDNTKDISNGDETASDIIDEIAVYHDLLYEPSEQTICIRIRMLVANGSIESAETLLQANEEVALNGQTKGLRLRAYKPVLQFYLENCQSSKTLALYRRMQDMPLVAFEADTYVSILEGLAKARVFEPDAPAVEGAGQLGFSHSSGPRLFDQLVQEMAEEIIELPDNLEERLKDSLSLTEINPTSLVGEFSSNMMHAVQTNSECHENRITEYVNIDNLVGVCPITGIKLQLYPLSEDQKEQIRRNIIQASDKERENRMELIKSKLQRKRIRPDMSSSSELQSFMKWLNTRSGKPFTVIVDGANVGFFNQNLVGEFSYHQIKFVHDALVQIGENPLVVLPRKYWSDSFFIRVGINDRRQFLTKEETGIRNWLKMNDKLAVTENVLDDYMWILATLEPQTEARKWEMENGVEESVIGELSNRRNNSSDIRTVVITNDLVSDHRMHFSTTKLTTRWAENCVVNYQLTAFQQGVCHNKRLTFSPTAYFSREIQCNVDAAGYNVWHFPIAGRYDKWLCIRLPTK